MTDSVKSSHCFSFQEDVFFFSQDILKVSYAAFSKFLYIFQKTIFSGLHGARVIKMIGGKIWM